MFIRIEGFGYGDNFRIKGLNKLCWLCDIDSWFFFFSVINVLNRQLLMLNIVEFCNEFVKEYKKKY